MEKFLNRILIGVSIVAVLGIIVVGVLIYQAMTSDGNEKVEAETSFDTEIEKEAELEAKIT
jgi:ABC-type transporter Mla subunit MlaD